VDEVRQLYTDAGFDLPDFALHIMARPIDAEHPVPVPDAAAVILGDVPRAVIRPPR
jgi:hypothetical protein